MSLERANEMVKFLKNLDGKRTDAGKPAGFKAREMYDHGMTYGVTNMEMLQTFLGKERAISRGRYLPEELSEERIQSVPKAKISKVTRKRKVTKNAVVAAVQASKNFTPSARNADRLAMIKEIAQQKEAEERAETEAEELSNQEEKSFEKGDSAEETCFEFEQIGYTQDDVDEEVSLMDTYL